MTQQKEIIHTIADFIKGGDQSDIKKLDEVMHSQFRNVQNGFLEEKGLTIIDKDKYLSLIGQKIFGGLPREMDIVSLDRAGTIAVAKVLLKSPKLKFISFISLVLDEQGNWKVMDNFPYVESNGV